MLSACARGRRGFRSMAGLAPVERGCPDGGLRQAFCIPDAQVITLRPGSMPCLRVRCTVSIRLCTLRHDGGTARLVAAHCSP